MSEIIKLDKPADDEFKNKMKQLQDGLDETDRQLSAAESSARGLNYANIDSDISHTRMKTEAIIEKLKKFKYAYDGYAYEVEQFDSKAARLLRNIPEINEWIQHSGWTADPGAVMTGLMEKLVQDGVVEDMHAAWEYLQENGASLAGLVTTCAYCGDPVNMVTGNFIYSKEDITIPGAFPLVFKRFYNSIGSGSSGVMGQNWTHNLDIWLESKGESVKITFGDGHMEKYEKDINGVYKTPAGKFNKLTKTEAGYTLNTSENLAYHFDNNGRLLWLIDLNMNRTTFSYKGGLLTEVSNLSGKLEFTYLAEGLLSEVRDHTSRVVTLAYKDGCLAEVKQPSGAVYQYQYKNNCDNDNGGEHECNLILKKIINPVGVAVIKNEYDKTGRNVRQQFADGGNLSFIYEDESLTTIATEQNGNRIKYIRDNNYRTVKIEYEGSEERFEYNGDDKRTMYQDRNGNIRRYGYDTNGNLTQATDPLGNITKIEYNSLNLPTSIQRPDSAMAIFSYDPKGNMVQSIDPLRRITDIAYNDAGLARRITMPDGSVTVLAYDVRGNINRITEACGAETIYEYDKVNRIIATIDGNGNKTGYKYNAKGEIIKIINAEGKERSYEYNLAGKLIKVTDFDGGNSVFEYNEINKPTRIIDPEGNETRFEYDIMWKVIKQTNANGAQTQFEYDKLQRLIKVTNALGHSVKYEYDHNGNRISITDPQGGVTHLAYDALNRVIEVTEADGAKSSVTYNEVGRITTITDAMENIRAFSYDAADQKTEEEDPMGNKTAYTYTLLGKISTITDAAGRNLKYEYAPGGLLTREVHPDGRYILYEYDAAKNLITKQDQSGYTLNYTYDSLNRIVKISSNQGQEKLYTYDAVGNVTSMTDAKGNTKRYTYSLRGELIQVIDALGNETEYNYDSMGELIQVKQFSGIDEELTQAQAVNKSNDQTREITYQRNLLGQIESIEDTLGQKEIYTYDSIGRITGKMDKDGYLTEYGYGQNGQPELIKYADGKAVRMSYDPLRRLNGIYDWLGMTTIETDPLGRATKIKDHNGKEVQYLYGAVGERLETVYPNGKKTEYRYDSALRLSSLVDGKSTIAYSYDKNSRLSGKQFSNGMYTRYEYNEMGLLSSLTHNDRNGVLDQYSYEYDVMGNKIGIKKYRRDMEADSGQFSYGYDTLGQLNKVTKDGVLLRAYAYDAFGNRKHMTEGDKQTQYSYNALNQLIHMESSETTRDYLYDARGNLNKILENGLIKNTYEFGARNRLTKATDADGKVAQYEYNGLGFRVGEQITDAKLNLLKQIDYVLDLAKQYHNVLERIENGQTRSYTWDYTVAAESGNEEDRFYLQDELGSPIRFIGADGILLDSYVYDEFGKDITGNQGIAQPFGYTGYCYDNIAETYFAQAREYEPLVGRFTARDIVKGTIMNPFTLNEYTYCWNMPISMVDLNGLWPQWMENIGNAVSEFWNSKIFGVDIITEIDIAPGISQSVTVHTGGSILVATLRNNDTKKIITPGLKLNIPFSIGESINTTVSLVYSKNNLGLRGAVHDKESGNIVEGTLFFDSYGLNTSLSSGVKKDDIKWLTTVSQKIKSNQELAEIALGLFAAAAAIVGLTILFGAAETGTAGAATPAAVPLYVAGIAGIIAFFGLEELFNSSKPQNTDCF